ncbi:MAG TPA: putative sugar O-methyltransferase [Actinomycetota bacterium]|nr:putative sugar O-methyltransferase [Actinomycetota bacterium]
MFESVKGASPGSFVRSDWADRNAELEAFLLPTPPAGFLRHHCILYQMFVGPQYLPHELPYVLPRLADCRLASEDAVGNPPRIRLEERDVVTSSNTIHHLYHLLRYEQETGIHVAGQSRVVEWGGGYGNLAKLFRRLHGGSPTYVLVDTPLFSAVQWLYLSSIFGQEQVVLHSDPSSTLAEGKFNVVPLGLIDKLAGFGADLFVSTWALNESTPQAQRHVLGAGWFGARRLLLAMHKGDPLEEHVRAAGARETPVGDFMPPQRYFVR